MNLLNLLIASSLSLLFPVTKGNMPCHEIQATIEIKNSTGAGDGSVTVKIDGNARQFRLNLFAPKKENTRLDLPVEEIKNLPAGDYELIITEAKEGDYCPKRIKVAIQ